MESSQPSGLDYDTDVSDSEASSTPRPGRYKGTESNWRRLNEDEIVLNESLKQLQAEDLAAHLYNAHAMKRRLYDGRLAKGMKGWMSKVCETSKQDADEAGKG
jgi:hypothetical protein